MTSVRRSTCVLAVTLLSAIGVACGADPSNVDNAAAGPEVVDVNDAILGVELEQCVGAALGRATAVVVGPRTVVTVAHPFATAASAELVGRDGRAWTGRLITVDALVDLAVIELDDEHPAPLARGRVETGAIGELIGYGGSRAAGEPRTLDYEVLRRTRITLDGEGERGAIEIAAAIEVGDSGAPLIDADGRVAGIVFAASRSADRGWAVDEHEVESILAAAEIDTNSNDSEQLPLTDLRCP